VFGRTRQQKSLGPDGRVRAKVIELPIEQWSVCIPDHHPGYVSWHEYLATRDRLRANVRPRGEGGGAAREGAALLQGILRCGRCGRRMQVAYSGNGGRVPRYACQRGRDMHATGAVCQSLGGLRLERAVAQAFLEAVTPAGIRASAEAITELEHQHEERLRAQRLAVERAEFEAVRARRQFAETTTARDRKELLRTLVAEAIVTVHQQPRRGGSRSPGRAARVPSSRSRSSAAAPKGSEPTRTRSN
jgi:Recombinase zinc beta ribbon domain